MKLPDNKLIKEYQVDFYNWYYRNHKEYVRIKYENNQIISIQLLPKFNEGIISGISSETSDNPYGRLCCMDGKLFLIGLEYETFALWELDLTNSKIKEFFSPFEDKTRNIIKKMINNNDEALKYYILEFIQAYGSIISMQEKFKKKENIVKDIKNDLANLLQRDLLKNIFKYKDNTIQEFIHVFESWKYPLSLDIIIHLVNSKNAGTRLFTYNLMFNTWHEEYNKIYKEKIRNEDDQSNIEQMKRLLKIIEKRKPTGSELDSLSQNLLKLPDNVPIYKKPKKN